MRMTTSVNVLALVRDEHRYVFLYDDHSISFYSAAAPVDAAAAGGGGFNAYQLDRAVPRNQVGKTSR